LENKNKVLATCRQVPDPQLQVQASSSTSPIDILGRFYRMMDTMESSTQNCGKSSVIYVTAYAYT